MSERTLAADTLKARGDTAWFVHDRFGLFIHWGIYSAAARHEWVKNYERISDAEYQKYFDYRDNLDWKSTEMLVQMLVYTVSKGGNLLLNVGPDARGQFEPKALERLRGIGAWMRLHGRSIYGCTASPYTPPPDCRFTQNGRRLYLHLFTWPFRHVHLDGFAGMVEYAQLLSDASEIRMLQIDPKQQALYTTLGGQEGVLTLELPVQKPDVAVPVIELFLKERL